MEKLMAQYPKNKTMPEIQSSFRRTGGVKRRYSTPPHTFKNTINSSSNSGYESEKDEDKDIYILLIRAHGRLPTIVKHTTKNENLETIIKKQHLVEIPDGMTIRKITSAPVGHTNSSFYEYDNKKAQIEQIFKNNNNDIDELSIILSQKLKEEEIKLKPTKRNINHNVNNRHHITTRMLKKTFVIYRDEEITFRNIENSYEPFLIMKNNNNGEIEYTTFIRDYMKDKEQITINLQELIALIKDKLQIQKLIIMDFSCSRIEHDDYLKELLRKLAISGGTYKPKINKTKKNKTKKNKTKKNKTKNNKTKNNKNKEKYIIE